MTWEYGIGGIGAYCVECKDNLDENPYLECGPRRLCLDCVCKLLEQLENGKTQQQEE